MGFVPLCLLQSFMLTAFHTFNFFYFFSSPFPSWCFQHCNSIWHIFEKYFKARIIFSLGFYSFSHLTMPEGKVKLSTLRDHPRKYSCQKQTSRSASVSVRGSGSLAGHGHCTLLNTTHNLGAPAITDQPVGRAVPAPLESVGGKVSHKARLVSFVQVGGSHSQHPITSPV